MADCRYRMWPWSAASAIRATSRESSPDWLAQVRARGVGCSTNSGQGQSQISSVMPGHKKGPVTATGVTGKTLNVSKLSRLLQAGAGSVY